MPMRHELVISAAKRHIEPSALEGFLPLAAMCLAGAVLSIYLCSSCRAFAELPSLFLQCGLS